tara:strand:- start:86 stop:268 length:183 start_codon:yes stop_codon:yes gene_type:complete
MIKECITYTELHGNVGRFYLDMVNASLVNKSKSRGDVVQLDAYRALKHLALFDQGNDSRD